jgi:hypothetical protein
MTGTRDEEQHKHASQQGAEASAPLQHDGEGRLGWARWAAIAAWVTVTDRRSSPSSSGIFCMAFGLNDFEAGSLLKVEVPGLL